MADTAHDGPGAIPEGVDSFTLLAEGFLPTHAPRTTEPHEPGAALVDALRKSCAATSTWDPAALLAQPPVETTLASIRAPSKSAAGLPAVINSFRVALPRLGIVGTKKVFLSVNQKDGFDCQSCAWPSPDGKRHQFEFCENGAKAMASEGGKRTIGADFFREWSIERLAGQSDEWLDAQGRLYITDRKNLLIIRGGANVYPAEVQRVLAMDPRVADSAAFALANLRGLGRRLRECERALRPPAAAAPDGGDIP